MQSALNAARNLIGAAVEFPFPRSAKRIGVDGSPNPGAYDGRSGVQRKLSGKEEETGIVISDEFVTLDTPNGPMRTHIVRPEAPGRYPGIVFYSEIFQITAPIRRTAAFFAGHGYIVAMPEIYHEFEQAGTVFAYDQAGSDRAMP